MSRAFYVTATVKACVKNAFFEEIKIYIYICFTFDKLIK